MKKIRIRQLLNLYNESYTNRERWTVKRDKALEAQHHKAAIKADTAATYYYNREQDRRRAYYREKIKNL